MPVGPIFSRNSGRCWPASDDRAETGVADRKSLAAHGALALLAAYRVGFAPLLGGTCRFVPSCSEYARAAVERHGALRGGLLALKPLARCHPWGSWGYDPVPSSLFPVSVPDVN